MVRAIGHQLTRGPCRLPVFGSDLPLLFVSQAVLVGVKAMPSGKFATYAKSQRVADPAVLLACPE
jgi:hypothetical protein